MAKMFKDRRDEHEVQNDILQETYVFISFSFAFYQPGYAQIYRYYCWMDQLVTPFIQWPSEDLCRSPVQFFLLTAESLTLLLAQRLCNHSKSLATAFYLAKPKSRSPAALMTSVRRVHMSLRT